MLDAPVQQVRSFNRTVTQRIGALQDEYLARGRPLGASRVLWEIGDAGTDVRALERHARPRGVRIVRLETNRTLREATNLYRSAGYVDVDRFNDEPYAHHWFEKRLEA